MFNTLKYAKQLEEVGVTRAQAERHAEIISEIVEGELTTKQDLKILETNLEHKFQQLEFRLIIKLSAVMGTMITLATAIFVAITRVH